MVDSITERLALFRSLKNRQHLTAGTVLFERIEGFIRVTPYVDVTFPLLLTGETEIQRLEQLATVEYHSKLEILRRIREQIQDDTTTFELSRLIGQ